MKLRIEDNSLRLRLSDDEVARFAQTGRVESTVKLGPRPEDQLTYTLERLPSEDLGTTVRVLFVGAALEVRVPPAIAEAWTGSEQIGFSEKIRVTESQELRILVEKDLDCKH